MAALIEIIVQVRQPPEVAGYNDTVIAIVDNHIVYACPASAGPNWRQPLSRGGGRWQESYGQIDQGIYPVRVTDHYRYGRCLIVAGGGRVASRVPNPNHDGEMWLAGIFVHRGASMRWRGSAGCPVVRPDCWSGMMSTLPGGSTGTILIIDA